MQDDERDLARKMIAATKETQGAVDELTNTLLRRDDLFESKCLELGAEVKELSDILIGKTGENGLTTRVKMLERGHGYVAWTTVAAILALLIAAIGLWL